MLSMTYTDTYLKTQDSEEGLPNIQSHHIGKGHSTTGLDKPKGFRVR